MRHIAAAVFLLAVVPGTAAAGDEAQTPATESENKQDSVVVEPYETRPNPTHEVALHDGRVYFLKELEETDSGYVLHTLEGEVIEVDRDEVVELKKLK